MVELSAGASIAVRLPASDVWGEGGVMANAVHSWE